jgi:hypothetical protein
VRCAQVLLLARYVRVLGFIGLRRPGGLRDPDQLPSGATKARTKHLSVAV